MKTKEMQQGTMRCMLCPCHLREKSKVNGWSKKNPKTAVKGIKHKKKEYHSLHSSAGRGPRCTVTMTMTMNGYWKYGSEYIELRIADLVDAPVDSWSAEHLLGSSGTAIGGCKYAENRLSSSCSAIGGCR